MELRAYPLDHAGFAALAEELISAGRSIRFRARGASMSPFIEDDDVVTVSPLIDPPALGDVVLVKRGDDRLVLHRVVRATEGSIVTRGDAMGMSDGIVPLGNALGKVVAVSGRGLHLRFPFKYLPLIRPAAAKTLGWIPGMRWLGRMVMRMLA